MPVEIPKEPKKYTSMYDNFKGVDYTDDASNVWRKRSPSGINMLPGLDDRPYKRKGWKVEVPSADFITAGKSDWASSTSISQDGKFQKSDLTAQKGATTYEAGQTISNDGNLFVIDTVTTNYVTAHYYSAYTEEYYPKRIHHFSLGSEDYMMFFNSMGVFFMSESKPLQKCDLAYMVDEGGAGLVMHTAPFPPEIEELSLEADSGRSFFFEGEGTAGFYTFVGNKLFRFDGDHYWAVDPYVPTTLIACDHTGVGEMYEGVNLLTRRRTVSFQCGDKVNGVAAVDYYPPGGMMKDETVVVETLRSTGTWGTLTQGTDYTIKTETISGVTYWIGVTFAEAPPVVIKGEDNMRITYVPQGGYVVQHTNIQTGATYTTVQQTGTSTQAVSGTATYTLVQRRSKTYTRYVSAVDGSSGSGDPPAVDGAWSAYSTVSETIPPVTISTPNYTYGGSLSPSSGTFSWEAYGSRASVTYYASAFSSRPNESYHQSWSNSAWQEGAAIKISGYSGKWIPQTRTTTETLTITKTLPFTFSYTRSYTYSTEQQSGTYTTESETIEYEVADGDTISGDASAFTACQRATVYGSGIINQVFLCASTYDGFTSRMWYSGVSKPNYFPDLNYVEVGANDTSIMGLLKCDEYLGVIKAGNALDSSIYLAYPTSFDDEVTYAVKQSIAGIGAASTGAFNVLAEEPVFLSSQGVMGIELGEEKQLRNRSYFINGKLRKEANIQNAISYVFDGMYYLAINGGCYVLDGGQKMSYASEKSNLQYECYYIDNIDAQCFAEMGGKLYFTDRQGNLCRFKYDGDAHPYVDDYSLGTAKFTASTEPTPSNGDESLYALTALTGEGTPQPGDQISHGMKWYTVRSVGTTNLTVVDGVAIPARWDTLADDDGAIHFFKNLQKKGCVISLMPESDSGVRVLLKADEKEPVLYGETDASGNILPYDYFVRKKIKKYKRLQIICENDGLNESFGIDQIVKTYTIGNYSKNRG